ncbi:hypothetical protein SK128_018422, partial [Halocaridina rubra]
MASLALNSDVELGSESESENECVEGHARAHSESRKAFMASENKEPQEREQRSSEIRIQSERLVQHESGTDFIQGLDEMMTCINSVDDHIQAGLQELRSCVGSLRKERTEMSEKIRKLSNEVFQATGDRDRCQQAIIELQQEVSSLREQLCHQQQDKENMLRRMQDMQQKNQNHLVKIAGNQRKHRLAHSAIVKWRRKALDKRLGVRDQFQHLEEENNELRAELLLCQEAAKKAFLRSANVLNSEALSMFQDAATRRLGLDDSSPRGSPEVLSPSGSPVPQAKNSQEYESLGRGAVNEDKENMGRYGDPKYMQRTGDRVTYEDVRGRLSHDRSGASEDTRPFTVAHGSEENVSADATRFLSSNVFPRLRHGHGTYEVLDNVYGDQGTQTAHRYRPMGPSDHSQSFGEYGAVGGRGLAQQASAAGRLDTNILQQETRAYLQQLRDDRRRRPEPPPTSGFESQRKTMKTVTSHHDPKRKMCNCRTHVGSEPVEAQTLYKCPYCTPIQNSSFGHLKETSRKQTRVVHHNNLSGLQSEKKK